MTGRSESSPSHGEEPPQQAGDGIEVTPEMVAAGRNVIYDLGCDDTPEDELAIRVYRAMEAARRHGGRLPATAASDQSGGT